MAEYPGTCCLGQAAIDDVERDDPDVDIQLAILTTNIRFIDRYICQAR